MDIELHNPIVIDGEILPSPLEFPPAIPASPVRITCPCGKDGSDYAHGGIGDRVPFTCDEVRAIRRRVESGAAQPRRAVRRLFRRIAGGAR
ncbi:hypothetical protein GCM10010464_35900 [Pseudonocardia yunnanensis]|uniref:Uncharacterized protein n=1 Tax=Pseudonocardia yunnanensis TaxID=58107 RepID=A0ABW4EQL7_9PSEU